MQANLGGILSYFTRHRTAANLLLVLLIALGVTTVPKMRAQFFPDVISDGVRVTVNWSGAGADAVDSAVIAVLEPAVLAVEGVDVAFSTAREGHGNIWVEFEPNWDMDRAYSDLQVAVESITTLPEDADSPEVTRGNWRDRVTDVVVHGPVGVDQLGRFADEFVARLFLEGVTRTTIRGVAAPQTLIEVPTLALLRHDLTMEEIARAISAEVDSEPAGDIEAANARVRTGLAKRTEESLAEIVLKSQPDGTLLRVGDVARIIPGGVDRERAYFVGENSAISIRVDRNADGDAIAIQSTVAEVAASLETTLPEGVRVELIRTRAEAITGRLNILLDNGLVGLALVVGLLFLFLNARTAFWVAAGIPVAMMAAVTMMYYGGLTLNMVSLFALIITLGIVVDDAIVVGEHADFRARQLGEAPMVAAESAARRMAPPVFSATITTVIAFFGLTAIEGRFGELIADIPFTVIAVLAASLVECFLILPNHMAHALAHSAKTHWYDWPSRQVNRGLDWFKRVVFRRLMVLAVTARYPVLAAAVLLLALQAGQVIRGDVPWRFFNAPERSSVTGNFMMLPGASRADTLEMMRQVQQVTEDLAAEYEERHGTNPLAFVLAEVGGTTGRGLSGAENREADLKGSIAIELIDPDLRPYSSFKFVGDLQDIVPSHPMLETISFRGWRSGPGGDAIEVHLTGAEADTLKAAAEALKAELSAFPEVSALQDSLPYDKAELTLELTPQGAALGFSIDELGRVIRNRLNGIEAATYPVGVRSSEVRVELPKTELTADFVESMTLRTPAGAYVPLGDIVTVSERTGYSTIKRENGLRIVTVNGDISEDNPARAAEITEMLETQLLPQIERDYGVASRIDGLSQQEDKFLSDALLGFLLCLVGIYLSLAWIFSSWTRPVVVMAVIPFGLIGAIYGHIVWDVPLSMFSVVGLIGMTGIIINDSIVLVSTVDEYARERGLVPAIISGTTDRLRPVLLTTLTTVLGLMPLLYESSQQAQFLKPTIITLVFGLGFGMLLVLLLVPALLAIQQDVGQQFRAARRAMTRPARSGVAGRLVPVAILGCGTLFVLTMGSVALSGALPEAFSAYLPMLADAGMMGALGAFLAGSAVLLFGLWMVGAIATWLRLTRRA